jgi:hypothetical protein
VDLPLHDTGTRPTHWLAVTSMAPNTVTCRFVPGVMMRGRLARSVQLDPHVWQQVQEGLVPGQHGRPA